MSDKHTPEEIKEKIIVAALAVDTSYYRKGIEKMFNDRTTEEGKLFNSIVDVITETASERDQLREEVERLNATNIKWMEQQGVKYLSRIAELEKELKAEKDRYNNSIERNIDKREELERLESLNRELVEQIYKVISSCELAVESYRKIDEDTFTHRTAVAFRDVILSLLTAEKK